MNATALSSGGGASPAERDSVRCDAWLCCPNCRTQLELSDREDDDELKCPACSEKEMPTYWTRRYLIGFWDGYTKGHGQHSDGTERETEREQPKPKD